MQFTTYKGKKYCLYTAERRLNAKKLFIFCHAGGTAAYYLKWSTYFPKNIELNIVELPGRGATFGDEYELEFIEAVNGCLSLLESSITSPFAVFGHSLGSHIAYGTMIGFKKLNYHPLFFISSATKGPLIIKNNPYEKKSDYLESDLIDDLISMGSFPIENCKSRELLDYFLPVVRADYKVCESIKYCYPLEKIMCPVFTLGGDMDTYQRDELEDWSQITDQKFELILFKGDHFYFNSNLEGMTSFITQCFNIFSPNNKNYREL